MGRNLLRLCIGLFVVIGPNRAVAGVRIGAEVGLSEFSAMCHARGASAVRYWQEMLGDKHRFLKWRS